MPPTLDNHSPLALLVLFSCLYLAHFVCAADLNSSQPYLHHPENSEPPPTLQIPQWPQNDAPPHSLMRRAPSNTARLQYYSARGDLPTVTVYSGDCVRIVDFEHLWDSIHLYPETPQPEDRLDLFSDSACTNQFHHSGAQQGLEVVRRYLTSAGIELLSVRWTGPSIPPRTTATTLPVTSATTGPLSPSKTALPPGRGPSGHSDDSNDNQDRPSTTIAPPTPTSTGADNCWGFEDRCPSWPHVPRLLIVIITITILAVGLLAAGSFYVYKTFFAREVQPLMTIVAQARAARKVDEGYTEEPEFMFDHRDDVIHPIRLDNRLSQHPYSSSQTREYDYEASYSYGDFGDAYTSDTDQLRQSK